jgi:hypothetical protein
VLTFAPLDLSAHHNNVGVTAAAATGTGGFNIWRNSLPAEEWPAGQLIDVDGVPFDVPPAGAGQADNICCDGQLVAVPAARCDWLYLLTSAERRVEDEVALHFADGAVDFEALRVSDFWVAPPVFGESAAFTSSVMHYPHHVQPGVQAMVWSQRVPVTRRAVLSAIRLPRNVAVHVFAITLCQP